MTGLEALAGLLAPHLTTQLLQSGLLPVELPPCFTTRALVPVDNVASGKSLWSAPAVHNLYTAGGKRRVLRTPNPSAYAEISRTIADHWNEIYEHTQASPFGLTKPSIDPTEKRSISRSHTFGERETETWRRARSGAFTVIADIANFYASIYTHSISWALMGKSAAKAHLGKHHGSKHFSETLDTQLRVGQDGQSVGIPIGPDSSLVAAEIVLSAIDQAVVDAHPSLRTNGVRYMDDFLFFTTSRGEAEDVLLTLERELASYGLALNTTKTKIVDGPVVGSAEWARQLRTLQLRDARRGAFINDVRDLVATAIDILSRDSTCGAISYALQRIARHPESQNNSTEVLEAMLPALLVDPSCALRFSRFIAQIQDNRISLSSELVAQIEETLVLLVERFAPLEHGNVVAWCLWIAARLKIELRECALDAVTNMDDCFAKALMARTHAGKAEWAMDSFKVDNEGLTRSADWPLLVESAALRADKLSTEKHGPVALLCNNSEPLCDINYGTFIECRAPTTGGQYPGLGGTVTMH